MPEVSYFAALVAGLFSFLSPCVLPLVPPYLIYLAGGTLEQLTDGQHEGMVKRAIGLAVIFVLGFSTVFILLGASATAAGALVRAYSAELSIVAGIVIIIMGLHFLGLFRLNFLLNQAKFDVRPASGPLGAFIMGLAFGFGWTPCIGPVLAMVLAMAATEANVARGALLLAVYSAGLGIPFILAAVMIKPFLAFAAKAKKRMELIEKAMGVLLILTGIMFLTGSIATVSYWLLETFPILGKLG